MPVPMMQERKKFIADQLNDYIKARKEMGTAANKDELFAGAAGPEEEKEERELHGNLCSMAWKPHGGCKLACSTALLQPIPVFLFASSACSS